MTQSIQTLDGVALTRDLTAHGLVAGQVGTVVECLDQGAFKFEFSDNVGRTYAMAPLDGDRLLVLCYAPRQAA